MAKGPRRTRLLGPFVLAARFLIAGIAASVLATSVPAVGAPAAEAHPVAEISSAPGPFVLVLGTAQDGGIPHLGGTAAPDLAARRDPTHRRLVTSLLVVDPRSGKRWLLDASPDLALQLERAEAHAPLRAAAADERHAPILDGIFLTHAHVGHYLGLAQLGREIYAASALPVHGSARMVEFLSKNGPWEQLVRLGQIELRTLTPGVPVALAPDLSVAALVVPHRDEYTDTLAFEVRGPRRSLLYLPDIDKWEKWSTPIESVLARVDVALLDATFYSEGELPGRSMAEVPHPLVVESIARFAKLSERDRRKVVFTHLNHSNSAALPDTPERRAIESAGHRVAEEMERIDL